MSTIHDAVLVDAPPEEVWHVIADPHNLPRWNSHVASVSDAPDRELEEGDTYRVKLRFMGVSADVRAEVLELRDHEYSRILLRGPVEAKVETFVRPVGSQRTRLEHVVEYHFPGGALGELVARAVRMLGAGIILKRGLRAQKEQVEQG